MIVLNEFYIGGDWQAPDSGQTMPILTPSTGAQVGQVTLGNIGSPDRLDFTVVGSTVNRASRVQGVCKDLGEHALVTAAVADHATEFDLHPIGAQDLRGLHQPVDLFRLPL